MAETSETQHLAQEQVTMSSSNAECEGSHSNTPPITTTAGTGQILPPAVSQAPLLTKRALNSTPRDDSILNLSR
jgi:hypothetical protein